MTDELRIDSHPSLERPVMIAAFRGWNDGGQGASLAGAYLALVRLPELGDLWETQYGRFLLLKSGIVALALVWGAVHHFVVRPRLEAGRDPDVRPSLIGEATVAIAVLLAAAILTNVAPPPVERGPAATAPAAR